MMDAKKFAELLRREADAALDAGHKKFAMAFSVIAAAAERAAEPEPTVHWHGPFEWHGGECPVPPDVQIDADTRDGMGGLNGPANMFNWGHGGDRMDIVSFSYAADNAAGWIERPEGWVPPDEAWPLEHKRRADTPAQRNGQVGNRELRDYEWKGVTHIRLLPRQFAGSPPPTERSWLDGLLKAARECGPMPDAERQAQRESWVRGEKSMGSDADEAQERERFRETTASATWQPIATAPRERWIEVLCPAREGLPQLISKCKWHPDAGFCVDELRETTHWRELQGD